jgi:hypothetical protein
MATGKDNTRSLLGALTEFFGLFAGLAALLYIIGGATIVLRLLAYGFLHIAAVTQLPHDFLLSIGLEIVVIPLLFFGGLYVAVRAARPGTDSRPLARYGQDGSSGPGL